MLYESQSYRVEFDDQVVTLWLDFRGRSTHSLTLSGLNELSLVLDRIARLPSPEVFIIRSSRPGVFLDEFDIAELARFSSPLDFAAFARRGQEVTRKLTRLPCPTVAVIEGRCIGAGLELALACRFRFAIENTATNFAFPDISRGLIPCWGSTHRLPRLIGTRTGLGMLFGEIRLGAAAAHRFGLVDQLSSTQRAGIDLMTFVDRLRERPHRSWRDSARGIASIRWAIRASLVAPPRQAESIAFALRSASGGGGRLLVGGRGVDRRARGDDPARRRSGNPANAGHARDGSNRCAILPGAGQSHPAFAAADRYRWRWRIGDRTRLPFGPPRSRDLRARAVADRGQRRLPPGGQPFGDLSAT